MEIHDTDSDADIGEVSEGVFEWVRNTRVRAPHPLEQLDPRIERPSPPRQYPLPPPRPISSYPNISSSNDSADVNHSSGSELMGPDLEEQGQQQIQQQTQQSAAP